MKQLPLGLVAFAVLPLLPCSCQLSDDAPLPPQDASHAPDGGDDSGDVGGVGGGEAGGAGGGDGATAGAATAHNAAAAAGASATTAEVLGPSGNPALDMLSNYEEWLSRATDEARRLAEDETRADNITG